MIPPRFRRYPDRKPQSPDVSLPPDPLGTRDEKRTLKYLIDGLAWGPIHVMRPFPDGDDPWGCLTLLRGTPFKRLIPVIPGEILSGALHGNPYPLIKILGPEPTDIMKLVPKEIRECQGRKRCALWDPKVCHPNPKMPLCYQSPLGEAGTLTVLAWVEGCYVLVINSGEFSLG